MKRLIILSMLLFGLQCTIGIAQTGENFQDAKTQLSERGEVWFRFHCLSPLVINKLSTVVSIDAIDEEGWVYAYANETGFNAFINNGLPYEVLTPPGFQPDVVMMEKVSVKNITDWDFYPTYGAYVDMMYQFQADYPEICTVFSIGQSVQGREILFARISDNAGWDPGEAQFLYTSTMHGDETTGYILMLRLIDYLLTNYGTDPRVTYMVDNLDIWINPLANPDGTYFSGNHTVNGAKRYNANNVDLNRNYPDPQAGPNPDGKPWQPETILFMDLAEQNRFVVSSNIHGGAEVCNYPWDTWQHLTADNAWWFYVCREYADTAHVYSPPSYMSGFNNGITNGYAWYTITGGRQDYMNYFHHCREFTLEISNLKNPPPSTLPLYWNYNYRSFLNYMEQSLFGIRGTVKDAITGEPVEAQVLIDGHDIDNSWVYSNPEDGWFYRLLHQGTYELTFIAQGYQTYTTGPITVVNRQAVEIEVLLDTSGTGVVHHTLKDRFNLYRDAGSEGYMLEYTGSDELKGILQINSLTGKRISENSVRFANGSPAFNADLSGLPGGIYLLTLSSPQGNHTWKLIRL